jgi:hypothetical protein
MKLAKFGAATAANMPKIATTTKTSISVNPRFLAVE